MFPVTAAIWLATQELGSSDALARVAKITMVVAAGVAIYGIFQFISPPPWDVAWVVNSDMETSGPPEPFSLRIFSTLNSTGPCADFLAIVVVMGFCGIGFRAIINWAVTVLSTGALALTLVRSAWLALVAGVVAYLVCSPRRKVMLPGVIAFTCLTAFLVISLPTILGDNRDGSQVIDRLQTFGDLDHDYSAIDREDQIYTAVAAAIANPVGPGLGNVGNGTKLKNESQTANQIDSGYVSRFYELGFLGCALYLVTIFGSLVALLARLRDKTIDARGRNTIATAATICVVMLVLEAAGDSYYGITGLYFWIALGVGLQAQATKPIGKRIKSVGLAPAREPAGVA
jgi:hypothetical protein